MFDNDAYMTEFLDNLDDYLTLAKQGDDSALLRLGNLYYWGWKDKVAPNPIKGIGFWLLAAKKSNSATAYYFLGMANLSGEYMDCDYEKAAHYFWLAIRGGNKDAYYPLGNMYLKGYGVIQDTQKALDLLNKAAENKNIDAIFQLHNMYANGIYVEQDYVEADSYFECGRMLRAFEEAAKLWGK